MPVVRALRRLEAAAPRIGFLPPLLARIAVGVVFAVSGWGKLHDLQPVVDFFRELGIPAPEIQAPFVAATELVCGFLVVVGLGARLAAVPLVATMAVAIATAIWPDASGLLDLLGRVEVLYVVLLAWIAIGGPGPLSLDAAIAVRPSPAPVRDRAAAA